MSKLDELLVIDGVDEGTAGELQARARDVSGSPEQSEPLENARALGRRRQSG